MMHLKHLAVVPQRSAPRESLLASFTSSGLRCPAHPDARGLTSPVGPCGTALPADQIALCCLSAAFFFPLLCSFLPFLLSYFIFPFTFSFYPSILLQGLKKYIQHKKLNLIVEEKIGEGKMAQERYHKARVKRKCISECRGWA